MSFTYYIFATLLRMSSLPLSTAGQVQHHDPLVPHFLQEVGHGLAVVQRVVEDGDHGPWLAVEVLLGVCLVWRVRAGHLGDIWLVII